MTDSGRWENVKRAASTEEDAYLAEVAKKAFLAYLTTMRMDSVDFSQLSDREHQAWVMVVRAVLAEDLARRSAYEANLKDAIESYLRQAPRSE